MSDQTSELKLGFIAFDEQRYEEAFRLLSGLAEAGDPEAQCMVGNMYDLGLGRERDLDRAIDWYQKSSRQGYGVASHNLATIYGMAGEADLEQVIHWRSLAREQGFTHGPID
jgi:TPR repeat protein